MALPVNIDELINGKTVEWERIEFRRGWNPERTLKTICAFANDFNNWSGGYIIIGVAENDGRPVLPPVGIKLNQIEPIQKDLNRICRKIIPNYFPIVEPVDFQSKKLLVIWCPGGSNRPYKAPDSLGANPHYRYFIRRFSLTVLPTSEEERELFSMAHQIPFDDQVNHHAQISDLDLSTIKVFLNEIGSDLEHQIKDITVDQIARRMNIAEGADEHLIPKNAGILFFAKNVHTFFRYAKIEFVIFKDESGTDYTEKIFQGPIHNQLKNALDYFKNSIVEEKVLKQTGKAEALRFFNYPYEAFEEALCNSVYHRGYHNNSPIEVRVFPDRIDIISFPGPLPPLDRLKLQNYKFEVRKYRNRRIGEFLKELHLTEGRSTGIPTILREMEKNGSPKPVFETDNERSYFKTCFKIHPKFLKKIEIDRANAAQVPHKLFIENVIKEFGITWDKFDEIVLSLSQACPKSVSSDVLGAILLLTQNEIDLLTLMNTLKQTNRTRFRNNILKPVIETGFVDYTIPDKPNSPKQKYIITDEGRKLLEAAK